MRYALLSLAPVRLIILLVNEQWTLLEVVMLIEPYGKGSWQLLLSNELKLQSFWPITCHPGRTFLDAPF